MRNDNSIRVMTHVKVFVKLGIVLCLCILMCMAFSVPAFSKSRCSIKLSCKEICNNSYQSVYSMVHTTNLPWYTDVTWVVTDTKVADIAYVDTSTMKTKYTKSFTMQAHGDCFINAKSPGTTWLTVKASGYKKTRIKIRILEFGDAIGYYAKTGKNKFKIGKDEKKAAKLLYRSAKEFSSCNKSRVDKVKAVHDYISLITQYDEERRRTEQYEFFDGSASGPLLYHKAVCQGYAVTFDAYMYVMGIPCRYVTGKGGGGSHGWNMVKMDDGKWYHMDVTWDDDDEDYLKNGGVCYDFFLKSDSYMSESHEWNWNIFPKCQGELYADYSDVINRQIIQVKFPGYQLLGSKEEAIQYLTNVCRLHQTSAPILYRADEWLSDGSWEVIEQMSGVPVYFWWDKSGCTIGGYRWYNLIMFY